MRCSANFEVASDLPVESDGQVLSICDARWRFVRHRSDFHRRLGHRTHQGRESDARYTEPHKPSIVGLRTQRGSTSMRTTC